MLPIAYYLFLKVIWKVIFAVRVLSSVCSLQKGMVHITFQVHAVIYLSRSGFRLVPQGRNFPLWMYYDMLCRYGLSNFGSVVCTKKRDVSSDLN